MNKRSKALFVRAQRVIPGGVNSPVRAFRSVGGEPRFIRSGKGSRLVDEDGVTYIDYVCSWGPLILGHAPAAVQAALRRQLPKGTSFGASTENEVVLAEMIRRALPSVEKVRLVNSGTEATMSAIRLARAFTGRFKILKFDGCYHGHSDGLLVKAGSGVATLGLPDSPGVPPESAALTLSIPFNNLELVNRALNLHRAEIAAVIVEPVVGNMGVVPPERGFLHGLRKLTREHGTLLIFDEVITGFRVSYGGAQQTLPRPARLNLSGEDHWRRAPGGGLWRKQRDHEACCAGRSRVPGRNAGRESYGDGGRHRHIDRAEEPCGLCKAGASDRTSGTRVTGGGESRGRCGPD